MGEEEEEEEEDIGGVDEFGRERERKSSVGGEAKSNGKVDGEVEKEEAPPASKPAVSSAAMDYDPFTALDEDEELRFDESSDEDEAPSNKRART